MLTRLTLIVLLASLAQSREEIPGSDARELMTDLSALSLGGEVYRVRDLTLRRGALSVSFTRGVLAFLEPVDGRATGAVFIGSGDVLALMPNAIERAQMARFTGSPILNERFDVALLRFTDDTREEILRILGSRAEEEMRTGDLEALLPWGANLGDTSRLLNFRLLQDLMGPPDRPIFFAALRGETLGWFDTVYDARSSEQIRISAGGDRSGDIWASFPAERERFGDYRDPDVLAYGIDTTISNAGRLSARAAVSIRVQSPGDRVLVFSLTPSLRVSDVRLEGASLPFFQHASGSSQFGVEQVAVVLPEPAREGDVLNLVFDYAGGVLERRGDGMYYVSERVLWYPHAGGLDPATYELTFHYPEDNVLVATGELVGEWEGDGYRNSRWSSQGEFVVAGFNYGDFAVESDESGPVPIYVHVNNDVAPVFEELAALQAANTQDALRALESLWGWRRRSRAAPPTILPDTQLFATRRLADNIVRQVRSILDFQSDELGPYPFGRLSVSQVPASFSQGWPTLLYVSTLSLFDREQRARLGLGESEEVSGGAYVLAHEIAHQWFGNQVTWSSYHDQWISEGFSNYMALRYLDSVDGGGRGRSARILNDLAGRLLARAGTEGTYDEIGPIWLGQRLASSSVPQGYGETVYPKATWVIHMLAELMRDAPEGSDARFFEMVRAFLREHAGSAATTEDLKAAAERYMTPRMDAGGDGTLDWFFNEWVFGTGIPAYALDYEIEAGDDGTWALRGDVRELTGIDFTMPLPVYVRVAGRLDYVGDVVASGRSTGFEFVLDDRPAEVRLDPFGAVLRR